MIKCNIKIDKKVRVNAKGTLTTVTKEFLLLTMEIYQGLKKNNESGAEEFRKTLFAFLIDPNSPLFKNPNNSEQPEKSPK